MSATFFQGNLPTLLAIVIAALEICAVAAAFHAVMHARTSQGAVAWVLALILLPFLTLPLYLIFGRGRFTEYVEARRRADEYALAKTEDFIRRFASLMPEKEHISSFVGVLEKIGRLPFSGFNRVRLLVDGGPAFEAMFDAIGAAKDYVIVQFFIIHDDELGRRLKELLKAASRRGVRVFLLYDEIGSYFLPRSFRRDLEKAGAAVRPFKTSPGFTNPLQINFRNHRKIVVVDGRLAFVGGLNVGDKYVGKSKRFGAWRDTHLELEGPAVLAVQAVFREDWYWATGEFPDLPWDARKPPGADTHVMVLPTGPADRLETCALFFSECIRWARRRVWIASPYFVPDSQIMTSLQLAALRGVDVRIMLPGKPDHILVYLSSFSFIKQVEPTGVKFFRFESGFLHQKVILVDDEVAGVGTANLDNRSFRLNFEVTAVVADKAFAADVASMLEDDFAHCRQVHAEGYDRRPFWFKVAVQSSRLLAPIQ